ncbi:transcription elongation factor GreA, partial [Candidatus Kuenenbacteria bacterium CG_4_8_14_3_um_filter_39_15]
AEHIQEAKELGDLSENAEYSAAKDEQAFLEMKIAELDSAIKNAVVIEENGNSGNGIVGVGSTVKFKDEADNKKECTIVGCHESDPLNNKISNESPIGRAFLGHKKGDTVEFQAPKGLVRYKILDIK